MSLLTSLDKRVISSLKAHVVSGYEKDELRVNRVIDAVKAGKISVSREQDQHSTFKDLCGDVFNPAVNTDIPPAELKRQERAYRQRFYKTGCWVMIARYWTGRYWEDSNGMSDNVIGGFVGYDFFGSGYELQMLEEALMAYERQDLDERGFVRDPFWLAG